MQLNLAYRWFCGLGIEDEIPDHSAFTCARNERFREHDVFRVVFERVVAACIQAELVGGNGFAVDASLIAADVNKCRPTPDDKWSCDIDPATAKRAIQDYLASLDDPAWGDATDVVPKFVAPAEPAAQWYASPTPLHGETHLAVTALYDGRGIATAELEEAVGVIVAILGDRA